MLAWITKFPVWKYIEFKQNVFLFLEVIEDKQFIIAIYSVLNLFNQPFFSGFLLNTFLFCFLRHKSVISPFLACESFVHLKMLISRPLNALETFHRRQICFSLTQNGFNTKWGIFTRKPLPEKPYKDMIEIPQGIGTLRELRLSLYLVLLKLC